MPGEASVTSELSDEDWLSSGRSLNSLRSISVCAVESFSIRSFPPSTVTVVVVPASCRLIFSASGTADLTSTSCTYSAKPVAVTVMWYGLNGTFGSVKLPDASVVALPSKPLTGSWIVTVAPGITAPVGSVTVPPR